MLSRNKVQDIRQKDSNPKPVNIFSGLKFFFYVFGIIGALPYSLSSDNKFKVCRYQAWLGLIVHQCMSFFILTMWIQKMDTKQMIDNPFMLISFARSIVYFIFIFLYSLILKTTHKKNEKIFRKIKKINDKILIKEKNVRNFYFFQITGTLGTAITFPVILYFFMEDAKNYKEVMNNVSLIFTFTIPNSTECHLENLFMICIMFLNEILEDLKKLSHVISKNQQFKIA